ncbi:DUF4185 domain-containing protein [Pseudonocardia abyssalis]|uniref:DUF4185 domain-containing protein n=1 Tax=Pseudonocardia abyssalis TaxID=2792008 RepID=A0ABS6UQ41_9PSEU|nr:DUF4185 domain-containing protein [Pseudonocardia abyssalis]MBW0118714.1 DUF4185 domain-containing protein [Pseudonocardia abyssalis]MBW0134378.1 DUF4185 domain-containing protein [Pseudonocardia abyssalis]
MSAASDGPVTRAPAYKVTDLTGPGHTDAFGIGGTDLGATTTAPDGRLVSVFGDTFASPRAGGRGWRSPVVLFGDPASVPTGLRWTGSAGRGPRARQVVRYVHQVPRWFARRPRRVTTVLPTDVITIGDTMYLHVMVCRELGHVHWTEIHSSRDQGVTWRPTGVRWPGGHLDGMFQMLTWELGDDGFVHAFTTGFQRDKGLVLHRVPADRITTPGAWESWGFSPDDGWAWGRPPTVALPGAYGELSLRRVEDRWLLSVFDAGNYRMDVLDLASPLEDLHTARRVTVLDGCAWEHEDHAAGRVAQLYGGYVLPGSRLDDLHLVVSQWNTALGWPYRAMQFRTDLST